MKRKTLLATLAFPLILPFLGCKSRSEIKLVKLGGYEIRGNNLKLLFDPKDTEGCVDYKNISRLRIGEIIDKHFGSP